MPLSDYKILKKVYEKGSDKQESLAAAFKVIEGSAFSAGSRFETEILAARQVVFEAMEYVWNTQHMDRFAEQPADIQKLMKLVTFEKPLKLQIALETVSQSNIRSPVVDAIYAYLEDAASLDQLEITARKRANKGSPPDLISRGLGTCSCCFGEYAVRHGSMVNHGYTIPEAQYYYIRTPNCEGVGQPPLEVSTIGLEHKIEKFDAWLVRLKAGLAEPATIESFIQSDGKKEIRYTRGEHGFEARLKTHLTELPHEIAAREQLSKAWHAALAEWQEKLDAVSSGPKI